VFDAAGDKVVNDELFDLFESENPPILSMKQFKELICVESFVYPFLIFVS
jgi:hypothetical protein